MRLQELPEIARFSGGLRCSFPVNGSRLAGAEGRDLLPAMPDDRLPIETDAPFSSDDALVGQRSACELKAWIPRR